MTDIEEAAIVALKAERDALQRQARRLARELGEAQGKLEASQWPGVVDGWKARAQRAEAALEQAVADGHKLADAVLAHADSNDCPERELLAIMDEFRDRHPRADA